MLMTVLKAARRVTKKVVAAVVPEALRLRVDAETYGIVRFMKFASSQAKPTDRVLDAGAGSCPYRKYFAHATYESTDFEEIFEQSCRGMHTFLCSLDNIPRPANTYDVIINTQVLMHVAEPQKVLNEFCRVLKPGGRLFLTAPQGWAVISAPYHFFNFTNFGLELLLRRAGLEIEFIKPRGGMFWYLGDRVRRLPQYVLYQYLFDEGPRSLKPHIRPAAALMLPVYLVAYPLCEILIPLLFFYLDRLDRKQAFTLGYSCYCRKPASVAVAVPAGKASAEAAPAEAEQPASLCPSLCLAQ